MSTVNWTSIASNLAAKCGGISGIVLSTWQPPSELTLTPAIVVFPPDTNLTEHPSLDEYHAIWPIRLYIERTSDYAEPEAQLLPYIGSFYDQFHDERVLALASNVQNCRIVRSEIDHLPDYGGAYIGCRFEVEVLVIVPVDRTA